MMTIERTVIGWRFWLQWVLLTILGYAVGSLAGFFLANNLAVVTGAGAGVGFMQWLALRRFVQRSGWWVLASIVGYSVSYGLYGVVATVWGYPLVFDLAWPLGLLRWALAFVVGGAMTGLLQQRILRRRVSRSVWWVLASAVGWGLSLIGLTIPPDWSIVHHLPSLVVVLRNLMLVPAVQGVILGTVTGGALIWLLRQPTPRDVF